MLNVNLFNSLKDKLIVISYDSNYKVVFEKEVMKKDNLVLDLETERFIKFKTDNLESEMIILNSMIQNINVDFNKKTNALDVYFTTNTKGYGTVKTVKLKDKNNLVHSRRGKKKIHILLPENYDENKEYNLLIMIDGQNMYDIKKVGKYTKLNDPYNGWQVETSLKMLYDKYKTKEFIVVGLETTGVARMKELTLPSSFGKLKEESLNEIESSVRVGSLDKTSNFIMDTVLPYMKLHYRISRFIGIGGSSAGGATSQYVGLKYHKIFKFILSLSPAMAVWSDETISKFYDDIKLKENPNLPYYFYNMGNRKGLEEYLNNLNVKTIDLLKEYGFEDNKIISYVEPSGEHNELMWRYATAYALEQICVKENEKYGKN